MPFDKPTYRALQVLDSRREWVIGEIPKEVSDEHLEYLGDAGWIEIRFLVEGWNPDGSGKLTNWYWPGDDFTVGGEWSQVLGNYGRSAKHPMEVRVTRAGKNHLAETTAKETDAETTEGDGGGITLDDLEDPIQVVQVADSVGRAAGRRDNLVRRFKSKRYLVVKAAGKWYCERRHAIALFPRLKKRIEKI